jgi:hypothetical protein
MKLWCVVICIEDAAYRLRYTWDQRENIAEHRFKAFRLIVDEHPNHTDDIVPTEDVETKDNAFSSPALGV